MRRLFSLGPEAGTAIGPYLLKQTTRRAQVEAACCGLKHFRHVAADQDELARHFHSAVLVLTLVAFWLGKVRNLIFGDDRRRHTHDFQALIVTGDHERPPIGCQEGDHAFTRPCVIAHPKSRLTGTAAEIARLLPEFEQSALVQKSHGRNCRKYHLVDRLRVAIMDPGNQITIVLIAHGRFCTESRLLLCAPGSIRNLEDFDCCVGEWCRPFTELKFARAERCRRLRCLKVTHPARIACTGG